MSGRPTGSSGLVDLHHGLVQAVAVVLAGDTGGEFAAAREPSFSNTVLPWSGTVCGERNSSAPISALLEVADSHDSTWPPDRLGSGVE